MGYYLEDFCNDYLVLFQKYIRLRKRSLLITGLQYFNKSTPTQNPATVIFHKIFHNQNYILANFQRKYTHPALRKPDILQNVTHTGLRKGDLLVKVWPSSMLEAQDYGKCCVSSITDTWHFAKCCPYRITERRFDGESMAIQHYGSLRFHKMLHIQHYIRAYFQ